MFAAKVNPEHFVTVITVVIMLSTPATPPPTLFSNWLLLVDEEAIEFCMQPLY